MEDNFKMLQLEYLSNSLSDIILQINHYKCLSSTGTGPWFAFYVSEIFKPIELAFGTLKVYFGLFDSYFD